MTRHTGRHPQPRFPHPREDHPRSADGHQDFLPPDPPVAHADGQQVAFDGFTVLRGSTRVVRTRWADPPTVCWCRVSVSTMDGSGALTTVSGHVLVFPFRATIGLLLVSAGMREGRTNLDAPPESSPRPGLSGRER